MLTKNILEEIYINLKIQTCQELFEDHKCNWDCCTYSDSYILLLPGEYESAEQLGYCFDVYNIIDHDYYGGMKIVPKEKVCTICMEDNGYKPLDCIFYPFWPIIEDNDLQIIAGSLCHLIREEKNVTEHVNKVKQIWKHLIEDDDILLFLKNSKMVGYENYQIN